MLRNYFKTAYRTLRSRPGITTINVLGLAVGLAVCACTGLYVADELSYDDFHPTAERLYRVVADMEGQKRTQKVGLTPQPVGPILERTRPEVTAAVRLYNADEPTGNLQSRQSEHIMETLQRPNRVDDVTIVQVAHSKKQASYGDHIVELANRKIEDDCRIGEMGPTAKV